MSEPIVLTDPPMLDETGMDIALAFERINPSKYDKPVGWATIPDSELPGVMAKAYSGEIDLEEDLGWHEGDIRLVGPYQWIITDPGHFELEDGTPCKFVIIEDEGWGFDTAIHSCICKNKTSWSALTDLRTVLNGIDFSTYAPGFNSILKNFKVVTANAYNGRGVTTTIDRITLPAEKEIFGNRVLGNAAEAAALTQLNYFKTLSNRHNHFLNAWVYPESWYISNGTFLMSRSLSATQPALSSYLNVVAYCCANDNKTNYNIGDNTVYSRSYRKMACI